jgi:hypothetical protein
MTTVWIYVDTSKEVGERDHVKVFANEDAAETWFEENDLEGVAFEYRVEGQAKPERPMLARQDWHNEEDRRANKRSWRVAITAVVIICVIGYLWLTTIGHR